MNSAGGSAVHFDLDGTLVTFDRPYADLLADVCKRVLDTRVPAVVDAYSPAFSDRLRPVEPAPFEAGACAAIDAAGVDADPERFVDALRGLEYEAATVRDGVPALLDAPAERHTMVGDDADDDIAGATAAGWRTVHLDGGTGVRAGTPADLVGLV